MDMRKIFALMLVTLPAVVFTACSSSDDNGGGGNGTIGNVNIVFKAANASGTNISGAKAVAVGRKSTGSHAAAKPMSRAEGDVEVVNSLLKVSDDMKFIEVNYTFNVEVAVKDETGKEKSADEATSEQKQEIKTVIQQVNSSLRIVPNFIFNVGDNYLWLSNCYYQVPGYSEMEPGPVKNILTKIRDDYNNSHRSVHGGQFIIRKSDGALFNWEPADGAPNDLGDGYNPQSMLNGWLHAIADKIYVREGGYEMDHAHVAGRVLRITDNGTSLSYQEIIPAKVENKYDVAHILPAGNNLGVVCREKVMDRGVEKLFPVPYIYNTSTNSLTKLVLPEGDGNDENTRWSLGTIAGEFYAVRVHHQPDGHPEDPNRLDIYSVNVSNATVGTKLYGTPMTIGIGFDDDKFFAKGFATDEPTFKFISNDDGQNPPLRIMYVFDPNETGNNIFKAFVLPEHYPGNINAYIDGIACGDVDNDGFYVCDITKDAAERVNLDWSGASQYQNLARTYVHFEAANMSIKYEATTSNGEKIALWVPITGVNKGKVSVMTGANGENYDVDVVVNMETDK